MCRCTIEMLGKIAFFVLLPILIQGKVAKVVVLEEHAIDTILDGYQKLAYPGTADKPKVKVDHSLTILGIEHFDYKKLVLDAWIQMGWNDPRLTWKGQPSHVRLPPSSIWKPDVILYRGSMTYKNAADLHASIAQNGHVLFVPTVQLETQDCKFSKNGTIDCSFKFGSWTYSDDLINLVVGFGGVDMSTYRKNGEFEIVDQKVVKNTKKYACCPELYADILYTVQIKPR